MPYLSSISSENEPIFAMWQNDHDTHVASGVVGIVGKFIQGLEEIVVAKIVFGNNLKDDFVIKPSIDTRRGALWVICFHLGIHSF